MQLSMPCEGQYGYTKKKSHREKAQAAVDAFCRRCAGFNYFPVCISAECSLSEAHPASGIDWPNYKDAIDGYCKRCQGQGGRLCNAEQCGLYKFASHRPIH